MSRSDSTVLSQPVFSEAGTTPDPSGFSVQHPSDSQLYKEIGNRLKEDVVPFEKARGNADDLYSLQNALGPHGPGIVQDIKKTGKIIFHAAGDTGASNQRKYGHELTVADQITKDCQSANAANRPSFLFHLGDVVYDFGESRYYYDQFYDPYRNYPAPIFAIPGNHDSFVIPNPAPPEPPLKVFARNFCAEAPTITPEARSLHRTSMTQPGVYFALEAPFVRMIGLFSNSLEDPGLISSQKKQKNKWPSVPDYQLEFLSAQLERIKSEKYAGAIILATHHPPFAYGTPANAPSSGGNHSGSPEMLAEIDSICQEAGIYPHVFLSGHAHNYQRFARKITFGTKKFEVPFIICGDGGHNVNQMVRGRKGHPVQEPPFGISVKYLDSKAAISSSDLILKHYDDQNYGYLRISVDKSDLRIGFQQVGGPSVFQSRADFVTVDLATHTVVAN